MDDAVTPSEEGLVEVHAAGIRTDEAHETPFLVLEEVAGDRTLLVAIGPAEATAIAFALQQVAVKRPMTHDALKQTIDALGARLLRVIVDHQPETHTFTANVVLEVRDGEEQHLDWRVSDSVALAVRCDPLPAILVPARLLAEPPDPWTGGVRVRCSCGAWIPVPEEVIANAPRSEDGYVDLDLQCPSCHERRHVRFELPPSPGGSLRIASDPGHPEPSADL